MAVDVSSRMAAQGLVDSDLTDVEMVVGRIFAVQAQDPRGARLAIRPRLSEVSEGPLGDRKAADIDRALNEGSLVVDWLNRGTLHLVRAEDHALLHGLTAPRLFTSNQTRLRQEGVSERQADRGVRLIRKRLADGPATRTEIRAILESGDVPVDGQALVHILFFASLQGLILRGPMIGKDQAFVLSADWLGDQAEVDPDQALAELGRRYLAGHGPSDERDLAKWAGVTLGQARKGLKAIAGELVQAETASGVMVDLAGRPEVEGAPPTRLLGAFDPILHGWGSREWIVPEEEVRKVVTTNGLFRPAILIHGRIVGVWKLAGGKIELEPFGEVDLTAREELSEEATRVLKYLDIGG